MLQDSDLERFLCLYQEVLSENKGNAPVSSSLKIQSDGLYWPEIRRLSQSIAIASVLGDAPPQAKLVIEKINRSIDRQSRYASLDNGEAWKQVIRYILAQIIESNGASNDSEKIGREMLVGQACLNLRNKGYKLKVVAYGVKLSEESQDQICRQVDAHIQSLGGIQCLRQICHLFRAGNRIHDGMWLFGDRVPSLYQFPRPEIPMGWLLSLSVKYLAKSGAATNPKAEWSSAIELATDFATTLECQRYSQFEQMSIHASEFWLILAKSLAWREVFSLPQAPLIVIETLARAFEEVDWPSKFQSAKYDIARLMNEIRQLAFYAAVDDPIVFRRGDIKKEYPQLWRISRRKVRDVNKGYFSPFSMNRRNQDSTVLFELNKDRVLILPRPMMLASACEASFRYIWKTLGDKAEKLVGNVVEKCVAMSCRGNAEIVVEQEYYYVGKEKFEIDVGTRIEDQIVLFETKAKSLTSKARSGDMFVFIKDYTESYLQMLLQLFRHERHIRSGITSLAKENDSRLRVTKVAVSPLSFGPASDHVLANSLLASIAYTKMRSVDNDRSKDKIMEEFNEAVARLTAEIELQVPSGSTEIDLHKIFFDVFWLDLGQFVYAMQRADDVKNALQPLMHITFSTRDFWTEVYLLDVQELTTKYWNDVRTV